METLEIKNVSIVLPPQIFITPEIIVYQKPAYNRRAFYFMNGNGQEIRDRILKGAEELFFSYGIRSITMDDIARHLSVSKKTLYRFFEDKDQIVRTLTQVDVQKDIRCMKEIAAVAKDPIDEILQAMNFIMVEFAKFHPSLLYDLQKYHPEAWNDFRRLQEEHMLSAVIVNLKKGIRQGLYRNDINISILARLRLEQLALAANPQIYPPEKFDLKKVEVELLRHFLHGILTLKGLKLLEQYEMNQKTKRQKSIA